MFIMNNSDLFIKVKSLVKIALAVHVIVKLHKYIERIAEPHIYNVVIVEEETKPNVTKKSEKESK